MIRARWVALVVACAFAALASMALANQITVGGPSAENVTYTSNGDGSTLGLTLGASNATCGAAPLCLSDSATFVDSNGNVIENGTYTFSTDTLNPLTLTNSGGGVFTVTNQPGTTTFVYQGNSSTNELNGTVTWIQADDGSPNPALFGRLLITSLTGDTTFVNTWGAIGDTTELDFNITGSCTVSPCALNNLVSATSGNTLSGRISGGEVAAEPGSMALLSLVILGGLFFERKRLFA